MRHGKFQKRTISPAIWVVLILAVLGMSFGGARAYLSHSGGSVTNEFITDINPTITVGEDYKVTVSNTEYAVYLRAAVVVNWKSEGNGNLLAAVTEKDTDYRIGEDWVEHEGFCYYKQAVTNGQTTSPVVSLSKSTKTGYTLVADVAVQAIQAVGQTDGATPIDAVVDAWHISPGTFTGSGNQGG